MYTTNLDFKFSFLFDLFFLKIQTDIIMQQTQKNNDPPPAEPIALNSMTLLFVAVPLLEFWFAIGLVNTGVVSFDRK